MGTAKDTGGSMGRSKINQYGMVNPCADMPALKMTGMVVPSLG